MSYVNFEHALEDNTYFCLQVGRYPQAKHYNRVREQTTTTGGYFVVDKKSKKWNGVDTSPENTRRLMTTFFDELGCGSLG